MRGTTKKDSETVDDDRDDSTKGSSIRRLIAIFAVLTFAPLTVLWYTVLNRSNSAALRQGGRTASAAATLESRAIAVRMDGVVSLAESLAAGPTLRAFVDRPGGPDEVGLAARLDVFTAVEPELTSAAV